MSMIKEAIRQVISSGGKCFVPYIMAGDGGLHQLIPTLEKMQAAGATMIEIGIPFSDPAADGPVIQEAGMRALREGTSLKGIFGVLKNVRETVSIPLLFMTYLNPIIAFGVEAFAKECSSLGIDGCIIPDLPLEEEHEIKPYLQPYQIDLIRLASIMSPEQRLKQLAEGAEGFLYAVTVRGVTGARSQLEEHSTDYIRKLKAISKIPVLAGFGISGPKQVREMGEVCDGVIVGSQMIRYLQAGEDGKISDLIQAAADYTIHPK
ncbi:tryptophan synthase subunit alpha [Bacillus sp. 1P06AnD]|uniref:tryptophan synthase subunit alpha n=1 Tax=Bacillus sp. 1P06AnD TaxID=3132208 RepID=UPI0039A0F99E